MRRQANRGVRTGAGDVRLPREIWVLIGGSFLVAIGYGIVAPALPAFAVSFDVGATAASVLISAFAFVRLGFAPISGRLVTRFGERGVYLCGIAIVAAGTLACAFATDYWQLLVFRAASGVGSTMFTVSAVGLLIRISPPSLRGRASGLWGTSFLLGGVVGPVLGSALVTVSLRVPFLAYGGALVAATVFVWARLRRSDLASRADDGDEYTMTFREAVGDRTYRAALGSNFAKGWVVLGIRMSLIPLFVTAVLGKGAAFTGIVLAVFAAANALVLLFSGRLADSWGRKPLAVSGLGLVAVGTVLLGYSGTAGLFLVAAAISGVGAGVLNPAHNAAVADVLGAKARGGAVLAGFQMASDVGAVLGPLAAGAIAEQWSYPLAFVLTGAVAVGALVLWAFARETLPRASAQEHAAAQAAADDACPDCSVHR